MNVSPPPPNIGADGRPDEAFKAWCGTLQLAPVDVRKAAWLDRIAGAGGIVSLSTTTPPRSLVHDTEPMGAVRCTACGGTFAVPEFVATFSTEYAVKSRCAGCR